MRTRFSRSDLTKEDKKKMKEVIKIGVSQESLRGLWDRREITMMVCIHTRDYLTRKNVNENTR